jgi:polyferredoxin
LLGVLLAAWGWSVLHRSAFIVDVLRDRNALYRMAEGGVVENTYTLKLVNKESRAHAFEVAVSGTVPVALAGGPLRLEADPEAVLSVPLTLRAAPGAMHGHSTVRITVRRLGDAPVVIEHDVGFFGPP